MGFVDGLGRLLSGKPVFQPGDNANAGQYQPALNNQTPQNGPKYIPEVVIERIEYYDRGNDFSLNIHIKNRSNIDIFVDKASLFGNVKELDYILRPGEMREFSDVHKGQKLDHNNYKYCELDYRTKEGDNFRTQHSIDYESKGDGIYHIKNLRFLPPVRDLYGDG